MGDRFYDDLEIALSSYSVPSTDDYNEEDEETEGEYEAEEVNDLEFEEKSDELACPFCLEDFDVLGLCCHIDADHRSEVKPGICPVCAMKVRINMASHVITQHESILKALCNKRRSGRSRSSIFMLRKELQEKHLRCIKESPSVGSTSDAAADSMLLSFVNNPQPASKPQIIEAASPAEVSLAVKNSYDDSSESSMGTGFGKNYIKRKLVDEDIWKAAEYHPHLCRQIGITSRPEGVSSYKDCSYPPFLMTCERDEPEAAVSLP